MWQLEILHWSFKFERIRRVNVGVKFRLGLSRFYLHPGVGRFGVFDIRERRRRRDSVNKFYHRTLRARLTREGGEGG